MGIVMKFNSWVVLANAKKAEGEFRVILQNTKPQPGEAYMFTSDPMTEAQVYAELEELDISKADVRAAIARARSSTN
jgi:hypothetical protein